MSRPNPEGTPYENYMLGFRDGAGIILDELDAFQEEAYKFVEDTIKKHEPLTDKKGE